MDRASTLYVLFVAVAAGIALAERALAARHEARLVAEGAEEIAPRVYRLMVPVYTLVFPAAVAEHLIAGRRPPGAWVAAMVILFAASKGLKAWAVFSLGDAWTMKVILPRALRVVTTGPYRYVRHPNYVAVMGEILALPLAGGAWVTAAAGGAVFLAILSWRVRTEESALLRHPGYAAAMATKARFLPGGRR